MKNFFIFLYFIFLSSAVYSQESDVDFKSLFSESELSEINFLARQAWNNQRSVIKNTKPLCLSFPHYNADGRSTPRYHRYPRPHSWYLDFYSDVTDKKGRSLLLKQLHSLENIGFLKKEQFHENESRVVSRFTLTDKGWKNSGYEHGYPCFTYGYLEQLGVTKMELKIKNEKLDFNVYSVTSDIGMNSDNQSYQWVKNNDILNNFKSVREDVSGYLFDTFLIRGEKGWDLYENVQPKINHGDRIKSIRAKLPPFDQIPARKITDPELLKHLVNADKKVNNTSIEIIKQAVVAPTLEEVKELIRNKYHQFNKESGSCFYLPPTGGGLGGVDRDLSNERNKYSVVIFPNRQNGKNRSQIKYSFPYLEQLVQIGVLNRHSELLTISTKDKGEAITAYVYEANDNYAKFIDQNKDRGRHCLSLGNIKIDFIEVDIMPTQQQIPEYTIAKFKLKISYKDAPKWMYQKHLLEGWPDLKDTLEKGKACMGKAEIINNDRKVYLAGPSCWRAFNSKYQ